MQHASSQLNPACRWREGTLRIDMPAVTLKDALDTLEAQVSASREKLAQRALIAIVKSNLFITRRGSSLAPPAGAGVHGTL